MTALPRYAAVKIALAGLTLEREDTLRAILCVDSQPPTYLKLIEGPVSSLPAKNAISANLSTMISIHSSHLKTWRYQLATARGEIFITDILVSTDICRRQVDTQSRQYAAFLPRHKRRRDSYAYQCRDSVEMRGCACAQRLRYSEGPLWYTLRLTARRPTARWATTRFVSSAARI